MAYKVAIGSSDGVNIDVSFGAASSFDIYEVDGEKYTFIEKRHHAALETNEADSKIDNCESKKGCGNKTGCGSGGGCGGNGAVQLKVELLSDCRSIVCRKIGFNVTKQLEKKAIAGFDVECSVKEALDKITKYFYKVDSHQSLRGSARDN